MSRQIITVIDDFLDDPDAHRALALRQQFVPSDYHKGCRSIERFLDFPYERIERAAGLKIDEWPRHGMNGRFQFCTAQDPIVYHADTQTHAATLYLTPGAPVEAGLSLYRSRVTGVRRAPKSAGVSARTFDGNLYDPTKWELVDRIGNIYNRLVIWDAALIHAPTCYFGDTIENARLFQMFFFDAAVLPG